MGLFRDWRRRRLLQNHSIPMTRWRELCASVPLLAELSADDQRRSRDLATIILLEKTFHGAQGFALNTARCELITALAAIPILGLDNDWYDGFVEIIVYPDEFRTRHEFEDEDGLVHVADKTLSGESWSQGPVILSFADVEDSLELDGYNVVLHEFAHKLDMRNGDANGMPPLHSDMDPEQWARAFQRAFDQMNADLDADRETLIDPYAAEDPAEFFAVLSEAFFECPIALRAAYPDVFAQLRLFYRQDPAERVAERE